MTTMEIADTARARQAVDDVAVIVRAQEIMRARGGTQHLFRADVHQAERELGLTLTIRAK